MMARGLAPDFWFLTGRRTCLGAYLVRMELFSGRIALRAREVGDRFRDFNFFLTLVLKTSQVREH